MMTIVCLQGQTKIADHIRRSYSLSDLTNEPDGRKYTSGDSDDESMDDETGMTTYLVAFRARFYQVIVLHRISQNILAVT